jgi:pyrroline-5-carboxylate reductase
MAAAGVAAGLPEGLATQLAGATVSGAGELARQAQEQPSQLRKNVTSPGGTTEAALAVLMADNGLQSLLTRAVTAATERSRALAG